jgi:hypothetical protein
VVRTISDALGLPSFGQSAGEAPITDIWVTATAVTGSNWGRLRTLYR